MSFLQNELFDLVTVRQVLIIIHILGLAIGAGAAFFSDFLFTNILSDRKIDKTEYRILKLTSRVVWIGLSVIITSGFIIFLGDTERLLDSSKFLAKMTIVIILTINGVAFHFNQIPKLKQFIGKDLSRSKKFKAELATPFFIGGAVSGVSWVAALVLGSLSFIDLSYFLIMGIYAVICLVAIISSFGVKKYYLS